MKWDDVTAGSSPAPETMKWDEVTGTSKEAEKTEALPFGTGTMYRMAHDPQQKAAVLAREYGPESVKTDKKTGELYAEKGGVKYSPEAGSAWTRAGESVVAGAAPAVGQVLGEAGGAAVGSLAGPVGTGAGFVVGGGAGTAGGEYVNNLILEHAAGAKSTDQFRDTVEGFESGAMWSAAGGAVFKGVPAAYKMARDKAYEASPSVSVAYRKMKDFNAKIEEAKKAGKDVNAEYIIQQARDFFGVDQGALDKTMGAVGRAEEQGVKLYTNPMIYAKEAPSLGQLETLAAKFGVSKVLESTRAYAERTGQSVAAKLGEINQVGRSAFGMKVDEEALGASLKQGAIAKYEKAATDLKAAQDLARTNWEAGKTDLEKKLATFTENRDTMLAKGIDYLGTVQRDMLKLAEHVGGTGDESIRAQFGELSKTVAKEVEGVKEAAGKSHGDILETAYTMSDAAPRVADKGLIDTIQGIVANALPSENEKVREILAGMLPASLKRLATAEGKDQGVQQAAYAGIPIGPAKNLPKAPMMVTLREMNALKQALGEKAQDIFSKVAATQSEGLQKKLYGTVANFISGTETAEGRVFAEGTPEAWKKAAGIIADSNKKYATVMQELDSKLLKPMMMEAKAGVVNRRDLDMVARDVFSGKHPSGMIDRLFEKYAPQSRSHLVGADLFNIFHDATESTGVRAGGTPPVNPMKVAEALANRDEMGLLKHYGDEKLIGSIREFIKTATAFGLSEDKSLPTSLVPSRTMQQTIEGMTKTMKALEAHIKADPASVFKEQFAALEKEFSGSEVLKHRLTHDAKLDAAAKEMMSHPSYIREVATTYGTDSPQFGLLKETFSKQLLSKAIDTDRGLMDVGKFLSEQNIHPDVAKLLSMDGSIDRMVQLGHDINHALARASDVYSSLHAGSVVANPPKMAQTAAKSVFGSGAMGHAAALAAKTLDRLVISKTTAVASAILEHPNLVKLLHSGSSMAPEARRALIQEWVSDVRAELPPQLHKLTGLVQHLFPGAVVFDAAGEPSVSVGALKAVSNILRKSAQVGYHVEPSAARQEQADYATSRSIKANPKDVLRNLQGPMQ